MVMVEDVQEVVARYMFTGELEKFTTFLDNPSNHPSGSWRTQCSVPLDMARWGQVSRTFREVCLEWRKGEMESMMGFLLRHALDRAFDLCDRDCYPYYGAVPVVSTVTHALFLQRQEVVAVHFSRIGAKRKHTLEAWVAVPKMDGRKLSDSWKTQTPRCGWKFMSKMRDGEAEKWMKWMRSERKALHWWFRDMAARLMDPESTANTDLPATMWPDANMWPDGRVFV